jgi:hypothetical protein
MKNLILHILIVLAPFVALAQQQESTYSINGKVNLLIGLDLVPAQEALVTVKNTGQVTTTDSLGNFNLVNLKQGKHQLNIIGASFSVIDTTITIIDTSINNLALLAITDCTINEEIAKRDIKNNKPRLLLAGGIAPVAYPNQQMFEKKFEVIYHEYGDLAPNQQCMEKYNQVIFKYLDKKYGRKWRRAVRKDVVGL